MNRCEVVCCPEGATALHLAIDPEPPGAPVDQSAAGGSAGSADAPAAFCRLCWHYGRLG